MKFGSLFWHLNFFYFWDNIFTINKYMENFEQNKIDKEKALERINMAQKAINNASERTEAEFNKTANTWLECFSSSIFVVETAIVALDEAKKIKAVLGEDKVDAMIKKLESLKERHKQFVQLYPDKDTIPPENVKQELFKLLNIFE